jgi:hypothetical protein
VVWRPGFGSHFKSLENVEGKYLASSTQQICQGLFGLMHQEKLKTQQQITERTTLENQITRAEVLNRAELMKVMAAIADAFASRVMSVQGLTRQAKEDLLKDLSSRPLALEDVGARQSRLPRGNATRADSVKALYIQSAI